MSSVVQELRRARRGRRLGDLEWFDVAYKVYIAALVGGGVIVWLSGLVTDTEATPAQVADVLEHGPVVLGFVVAVAIALGLRSGSDGGPVSVEAADVRHLLLAPVPRRDVLARPVVQRLRSVVFAAALVGGVAGQLAARRLPGSPEAWAASGALAGAATGALFVAVAVLVHVGRIPRWLATAVAVVVLAVQGAAIAGGFPGPFDTIGSVALWGMRQEPVDLVGIGVALVLSVLAVALSGRLRVEALVRRADLVSQLRFAVTMQDLRTVVLLRRQLRGERPRNTPWIGRPRRSARRPTPAAGRLAPSTHAGWAIWQRGWRGLLRYPLARIVRMAILVVAAGIAVDAVLRGTTPALVGVGGALYLLGLDAVEPLSQEIDHPDHTDAIPRPRGWLMAHHLVAPAIALVPFALLGAVSVIVVRPDAWAFALALCVPVTMVGICGSVVSIVRDAPDPLSPPTAASAAVPPEFAGFTSTLRLLWPIAVSTIAGAMVLAARELPTIGTVLRMVVASGLVVGGTVWWVRRRDEWRKKWRAVLDGGRNPSGATT
ncbi:MAG: hypothetical protein ABW195_12765 [Ilumatobacteraceae bacterium]